MSSNIYEEVREIKKREINESKKIINGIKRCLHVGHPNYDTIVTISKYHENEVRFHQTTIMLVTAAETEKPKTQLENLIRKRLEYMTIALELLPKLVAAGVICEETYLETCRQLQKDYGILHVDMLKIRD